MEVPKANALYEKYGTRMTFIGVNVGYNDSIGRTRKFMKKNKMTYPVLFDKSGKIGKLYKIRGVPTVIVADKNGKIAFRNYGVKRITDEWLKELNQ